MFHIPDSDAVVEYRVAYNCIPVYEITDKEGADLLGTLLMHFNSCILGHSRHGSLNGGE